MPHVSRWPRLRSGRGAASLRLALAVDFALLAVSAAAQTASSPLPAPEPLTTIRAYWETPVSERQRGLDYRFEADVTYSDPAWGHVWLQDETAGVFFGTDARTPTFTAGQRVRISGHLPTDRSLTLTDAQVELVGAPQIAPLPLPETGWYARPEAFNDRLVTLEAHIDRQVLADPEHLHLFLSADGHAFYAWLLLPPGQPEPQLAHANIRLRGVFSILRTTDGKPGAIELKIQHPAMIEVLHHLDDDPRFALPVSELATLRQRTADGLVHVAGLVRAQQPGHSITLRDDTGQIEVLSGQTLPCRIGEPIEAIGYPSINGTAWELRAALYRPHRAAPAANAQPAAPGLPVLRLAADVLELTAKQADRTYPVALSGVVTWAHPDAPFFFIQDSSGGVQILHSAEQVRNYQPGRSIDIRGVSRMGPFAPAVLAAAVRKTGDMPLPRAEAISLEHALTGRAEAQYVELRGLVRTVGRETPWTRLELTTAAGDFAALLPGADEIPALAGAVVRIRGVCSADTDNQRRIRGVRLWLRSPADIQIEEPAPADVFALPLQPLAELGRFGAPQSSEHRVHLSGVVLAQLPGRWVQIQDGDMSLRVLDSGRTTFDPGHRIEAVGYLTRRGGRMVLREAACRPAGASQPPAPLPFTGASAEAVALDGRLITVHGQLLNTTHNGPETRLNILASGGLFTAFTEFPLPADLPAQSRLSVTGLIDLIFDEQGQPTGFRLRSRSLADITLLERPSWFTAGRMWAIAAILALGVGLALLWIVLLRRRVQRQTDQIRGQLQRANQLEAELQHAARLESLGLLAGGIAHDFNNLLTVILGHLSLAALETTLDAETAGHVQAASHASLRARDLTQQLLTFAKGGSPVRTALSLPELVREVAEFVLRGTAIDCQFAFAPDLRPAVVDKGQISQVVQNLTINALQAMPSGGHIRIALANEQIAPEAQHLLALGPYLHLTIADTGIGIAPEVLPRIFEPYFTTKSTGNGIGLATVYSIVRKHGGHITVESTLGAGTTFHLLLPAGEAPLPPTPSAAATHRPALLTGRILLMDDEAGIRRLGTEMLQHLGLEVDTAADGRAAIEAYARAAQSGRPYDLVVLDLTIPGGMGGLKTLENLRKLDPLVRAVVSSGYSEDEVLAQFRSYGFCAMVPKPYNLEELTRALRPLLPRGAEA